MKTSQLSLFLPIGTPITYRGYPGRVVQGVTQVEGEDGAIALAPYNKPGAVTVRYKAPWGMGEVVVPIWRVEAG